MSQHDGDTNRLRLAQGSQRPWIRHACAGGSANTWLFCVGGLIVSWQVSWWYASLVFTHRPGGGATTVGRSLHGSFGIWGSCAGSLRVSI